MRRISSPNVPPPHQALSQKPPLYNYAQPNPDHRVLLPWIVPHQSAGDKLSTSTTNTEIIISAINATTNTITLSSNLNEALTTSDDLISDVLWAGFTVPVLNTSVVSNSACNFNDLVSHELLHNNTYGKLHDLKEITNLMHYTCSPTPGHNLAYKIDKANVILFGGETAPASDEFQWNLMHSR